jgi:pyruvate kinase
MAISGMEVARINFSHGTLEEHASDVRMIRKINTENSFRVKVLQDLEGHRIRTGLLSNHQPVPLKKHQPLRLTREPVIGDSSVVSIDYPGSLKNIRKGQRVFIDDGTIDLRVKEAGDTALLTEGMTPQELGEQKGVNIPGVHLEFGDVSEKDKQGIAFAVEHKVDFIAQSFVRSKEDVQAIRQLIGDKLPECRIIAKIENEEGIQNLDEIIAVVDGIMVARGDLGVSLPIYEVPLIQKQIIRKCNRADKLVITATQMLESMVHEPLPTRAEVSDVANAILDGSDYVMLSAETAIGSYPIETVTMMKDIIDYTENHRKVLV